MSEFQSKQDLDRYLLSVSGQIADADGEHVVDLLRQFLVIVPGHIKTWARLGKIQGRTGDTVAALTHVVRSELCAPDAAQAPNRLVKVLRSYPSAATGLSASLLSEVLGPDDPVTMVAIAAARLDHGDVDGAQRLLRRVAILAPGLGRTWVMLALSVGLSDDAGDAGRSWWIAWIMDPSAFDGRQAWAERIAARHGSSTGALPLLVRICGTKLPDVEDRRALIAFVAERPGRIGRPPRRGPDVTQPLVLISQIQRSGGSLIIELLDDHPEVFAYPYELILGKPLKSDWPDLDLSGPVEQWMAELFEPRLPQLSLRGFAKSNLNRFATDRLPFGFDIPGLIQRFLRANRERPADQRELMNRYFTAFFGSWENSRPSGSERWIAAFAPRLVMHPLSMRRYRRDYPDGHLVGSIRHPRSWLISAQRHSKHHRYHANALELWQLSTEAILEQYQRAPGSTTVMIYEDLVSRPETETRRLAGNLGIEFRQSLLTPTLTGRRLKPNSSFDVNSTGIHRESLARDAPLQPFAEEYLETQSMPIYREACRLVAGMREATGSGKPPGAPAN